MNQQTQKQPAESPAEIYEYHMVPAILAIRWCAEGRRPVACPEHAEGPGA